MLFNQFGPAVRNPDESEALIWGRVARPATLLRSFETVETTATELMMGAAVCYVRMQAQEVFRNNTLPERTLTLHPSVLGWSQHIDMK